MSIGTDPVRSGVGGDISPDFEWSKLDAEIIGKVLPHEATPKAIRVFNNVHRPLSDYAYWFTLGTLWVSYTDWSELELWKRLLRSPRPKRETSLMKPSELEVWRSLPDDLTLYRAHRPGEKDWISYTLAPAKAAMFARLRGISEVHQYRVAKDDALCLFLRRGEMEVLALDKQDAQPLRSFEVRWAAGAGRGADDVREQSGANSDNDGTEPLEPAKRRVNEGARE